jgi:phytanoyl-CoA hydroxylase
MSSAVCELPKVDVSDIEVFADRLDPKQAAQIYKEYGCLVVRGLQKQYTEAVNRDIEAAAQNAISLLDRAKKVPEGWVTPDGTLFLPAPKGFKRDKQIMVLACGYTVSAAFFKASCDAKTVDIMEEILGPNIELFLNGQCLYKEPVGGHPKHLHQDGAYFEHKFEGPVATLSYVVDTDLNNGALHVIPGSHKLGILKHVDTFSHLGLDEKEWPWERALPIIGKAGDVIFFHVKTVHGSKENHSPKPRPVFINRYRRPDDYITVGATTTENRAESEKKQAERKKTRYENGLMVRGFRPYSEEQ